MQKKISGLNWSVLTVRFPQIWRLFSVRSQKLYRGIYTNMKDTVKRLFCSKSVNDVIETFYLWLSTNLFPFLLDKRGGHWRKPNSCVHWITQHSESCSCLKHCHQLTKPQLTDSSCIPGVKAQRVHGMLMLEETGMTCYSLWGLGTIIKELPEKLRNTINSVGLLQEKWGLFSGWLGCGPREQEHLRWEI